MNYKNILQTFLDTKSKLPKVIVIYGPTACGKTSMSIEIAQFLDTQIISTDSRQIFRGMDIGTGKVTEAEKQGIIHHMIDIINPDETYSVGAFKHEAERHMQDLWRENKIPLLVGGTGLYIDSLIYDFSLGNLPSDISLREKWELLSNEELYHELEKIDPEYARELHSNNRPYIERALEVKILTGKSKKDFRQEKKLRYDVLFLTPYNGDRDGLYERINTRVEQMFEQGLEQEVGGLLKKGYTGDDFGMKSIGYKEFFPYFNGEIGLQEVISQVQQYSRNYAKRQLTWFSKYTSK